MNAWVTFDRTQGIDDAWKRAENINFNQFVDSKLKPTVEHRADET